MRMAAMRPYVGHAERHCGRLKADVDGDQSSRYRCNKSHELRTSHLIEEHLLDVVRRNATQLYLSIGNDQKAMRRDRISKIV